jgi:hypothetical protein
MEVAARVIQCSWKYYRLRKQNEECAISRLAEKRKSRHSIMSFRKGMSAINRKTCEENFQRSLMKWRKVRQFIRFLV